MSLYLHMRILLTQSFSAELTMDTRPARAVRFVLFDLFTFRFIICQLYTLQKYLEGRFKYAWDIVSAAIRSFDFGS